MNWRQLATAAALTTIFFVWISRVNAQNPPEAQIYWLHSPLKAASMARQFNLPILVYVASDNCGYCRKMEREVWSNPQIIEMVENGFIPLELNAERDAKLVAGIGIGAFPTTLLFSRDVQFITGGAGYLPPSQVAGLLRAAQRAPTGDEQLTQNK